MTRTGVHSAVAVALLLAAVPLGVSGCSVLSSQAAPVVHPTVASSTPAMTKVLTACGLSSSTAGVTLTADKRLHLDTQTGSRPSGIDRLDAQCVLDGLRLPEIDRQLLESTSISGGTQTVDWSHFTATWSFRDTLTFTVDVYPTA